MSVMISHAYPDYQLVQILYMLHCDGVH
jgi:hypothetical protein